MKYVVILIVLFISTFLFVLLSSPSPNVTATVSMDGKGHYRLISYEEKDGCIMFHDFTNTYHKFCGAYEIIPIEHYIISPERIEILEHLKLLVRN